jgi:hypothetical protein
VCPRPEAHVLFIALRQEREERKGWQLNRQARDEFNMELKLL